MSSKRVAAALADLAEVSMGAWVPTTEVHKDSKSGGHFFDLVLEDGGEDRRYEVLVIQVCND